MSRVPRIVVPRLAHHVTQRGNRRTDVFETDAEYEAYLLFLKQHADKPVHDVPALHRHSLMTLNAIAKLVDEHREAFLETWYEFFDR